MHKRARPITNCHEPSLRGRGIAGDDEPVEMKAKIEVEERQMKRLSVSVPAGVYEALDTLARRSGLRPSEVAREALREYRPLLQECERVDQASQR